jgi:hypothetical protein
VEAVQFRRRISKRIRRAAEGMNLAADINADVSVNASENRDRRPPRPPAGGDARRNEQGKETR